jgi:tetratricopeptide (TPR) repeat protein
MDKLDAHLDRAWDLIKNGDFKGAKAAARRALLLDKKVPDVHHLLGYIARCEGEIDEALDHFRDALSVDEGFVDAYLDTAELLIHPVGDIDKAIEMLDDLLDNVDDPEITLEAQLLKIDALTDKGDLPAAEKLVDLMPTTPSDNDAQNFAIARVLLDHQRTEAAEKMLKTLYAKDPHNADVLFFLGIAQRELARPEATLTLIAAREAELAQPRPPWAIERDTFAALVKQAIAQLAEHQQAELRDVAVYCLDLPAPELIVDGIEPRTALVFDGVGDPTLGKVAKTLFVYQRNIERIVSTVEQMQEEVRMCIADELDAMRAERSVTEQALVVTPVMTPAKSPRRVR